MEKVQLQHVVVCVQIALARTGTNGIHVRTEIYWKVTATTPGRILSLACVAQIWSRQQQGDRDWFEFENDCLWNYIIGRNYGLGFKRTTPCIDREYLYILVEKRKRQNRIYNSEGCDAQTVLSILGNNVFNCSGRFIFWRTGRNLNKRIWKLWRYFVKVYWQDQSNMISYWN